MSEQKKITKELLRAFARGELDDSGEESVLLFLRNRPDLKQQVVAIRLVRELGRGGMGVIYLAEHVLTKRPEVLNVLPSGLMTHLEARRRFEQETQVTSVLDHESIVRCYSVKMLRNSTVLCMEYLPGGDLNDHLERSGPLSLQEACCLPTDVDAGLLHAQERKVNHRDINPSNIMLYKSGERLRAKLTDFGLGQFGDNRAHQKMTDDGHTMGTIE